MSYTGGMRPTGSPQDLEHRRHAALALLKQGWLPHEVAKRIGVDRRSVRRWRSAHRRHGLAGVGARPASGRPRRLPLSALAWLRRRLLVSATASGFSSDLWTCPRVAQVIQRQFGVHYHVDHVNRVLHRLGFTPQRPSRQPRERDERLVRRWMATTWVEVKKKSDG